jgi:hypothetical protein
MSYVLNSNSQTAAATSISVTYTVPAGGRWLDVVVTTGGNYTAITGVTDGTNTFVLDTAAYDATDGQSLSRWKSPSLIPAGSYTLTASFASIPYIGIAVAAVPNSTGQIASLSGNYQAAPGTGTGGVTTGSSGTLSSAPALLLSWVLGPSGTISLTSAGGSTVDSGGSMWTNIKANFLQLETQVLNATTSVAGTWTSANGNPTISVGGVWQQPNNSATVAWLT